MLTLRGFLRYYARAPMLLRYARCYALERHMLRAI